MGLKRVDPQDKLVFVSRLTRQHSSLVMVVPRRVQRMLCLEHGDLVSLVLGYYDKEAIFKLAVKGVQGRERSKRNTNRVNQSRSV